MTSVSPSPSRVETRLPSRGAIIALLTLSAAVMAFGLFAPGARVATAGTDRCNAPEEITDLREPLPHTAARLAAGKQFTIVALGSSSTYGTGATKPENSYPSRLAALLQARFPDAEIRVLNRGVGGERGPSMAARIPRDVLVDKPDLVIWQVGTNDVLGDLSPDGSMKAVRDGIQQIKQAGADVILMDMQYAPAVLAHPNFREMERALWQTARATNVPIFRRFALMRDWTERGNMKMSVMLARDNLHMTDASYDCLARQLSASILRDTRGRGSVVATRG